MSPRRFGRIWVRERLRRAVPPAARRRWSGRRGARSGHRAAPRRTPGRLPSLGQDVDAGHRSYVANLEDWGVRWLRTKPFSALPSAELPRCLHSFAHIVESLSLPDGAEILDVGCGPGWLSEWLARCGFHVTGVDISEDMIAIARERLEGVPSVDAEQPPATGEFHVMATDELPFEDRFDAAILYDAMHHFADEHASLGAVWRALAPGGQVYLHEGVRPPDGSEGEQQLIGEMKNFGTLEAPFDPDYLVQVLEAAGFVELRRFVEADRLIALDSMENDMQALRLRASHPDTNTIIARKPEAAAAPNAVR